MGIGRTVGPGEEPVWNSKVENFLEHYPIHVQNNEPIRQTTWHRQPGIEIHLTHHGKVAFISDGQFMLQQPKYIVVHRGDVPHRFISLTNEKYRRSVVCIGRLPLKTDRKDGMFPLIDFSWIVPNEPLHLMLDGQTYNRVSDLCLMMEEEIARKSEGWQELALAHALELTVLLKRLHTASPDAKSASAGQIPQVIQQCMNYVVNHLGEELSLGRMARKFAISEEHLTRSFTKEIGVSFHQFVIASRIDESRRLLTETSGRSVLDVALQVGFSSLAHFSSTFKSMTGESPTQYRKTAASKSGGSD